MIIKFPKSIELRTREVGGGQWELDYREGFDAADREVFEKSAAVMKSIMVASGFPDIEMKTDEGSVGFRIRAGKEAVFNMLAGEFLGQSSIAKLSLVEILALAAMRAAAPEAVKVLPYGGGPDAGGR